MRQSVSPNELRQGGPRALLLHPMHEKRSDTALSREQSQEETEEKMKSTDGTVQMLPRGRKLPYIDQPRNVREALARINRATDEWAKTTEDFVYRVGGWFTYVKARTPHGGFEDAIRQTRFNPRTVRRFMVYFGECNAAGRVLPYHPNPHRKSDTVSVLEPPKEEQPKPEKPQHEGGHSIEWNATDCA